jgi:hypothetical protein
MHPNIVTVYNFGELADGSLFLAMEYVEGTSLSDIIGKEQIPLLQAVRVARQCAAALGYAHTRQVIHRDFKPSNVIITQLQGGDHVKVLDFGLARLVGETTVTQSGTLVGTPRYMTPEQWQCKTITARVDQYSLGQVLWEMLAGKEMVDTPWPMECMHKHLNEAPTPPSELRAEPGIEILDPIVIRMLSKNPDERYEEMHQVGHLLQQVEERLTTLQEGGEPRPLVEAPPGGRKPGRSVSNGRSDSVLSLREHPAAVALLGKETIAAGGSEEILERHGLSVQGRCRSPAALGQQEREMDLFVVGTTSKHWRQACEQWADAGLTAARRLACIKASDIQASMLEAVDHCSNLLFGTLPPDPLALAAALSWMRWNDTGGLELLWPDQPIMMRQLTSPSLKSSYVDDLLDDAKAEGVRQRTLRALAELSEEMITSAFFHAQTPEANGDTRLSSVIQRELPSGHEVTLRWVFSERFIGLSVKDPFGTLSAQEIIAGIAGVGENPRIGLRIMFRAAHHLFFALCPGTWSEMMALVERDPEPSISTGHSLCVLQGLGQKERRIGDRLEMDEVKSQELRCVTLKGEINETSDFRAIFRLTGKVVIDMSGITRINSMGIQSWIDAARNANDQLELIFERCSLAVVSQLNMIPKFARTGRVASIQAPYFCTECEKEYMELLPLDEIVDKQPPPRSCSSCNTELQFDELPEVYFSFTEKR